MEDILDKDTIKIYTDGSCLGNPGPGGWAAIILDEDYKTEGVAHIEISGSHKDTTNNRMEMKAIIEALKYIRKNSKDIQNRKINIYSDSNLIIQTLNKGWKKKANTDLWAEMDKERAWLDITWTWVKAHSTNKYNNLADAAAVSAAKKQQAR